MGRNSGKRIHRKPRTKKPKAQSREDYMLEHNIRQSDVNHVNYGVITKYHGNGGKCTVNVLLDSGFVTLPQISLKGSLANSSIARKLGQRLVVGSIVLVDDGTIVLVYQHQEHSVIDRDSLSKLTGNNDTDFAYVEEDSQSDTDSDNNFINYEDDDDEEDENFTIDTL